MTGSVEASRGRAPVDPTVLGRVPDFFIVGHPKCGTTALYEMLKAHPQIYMPELKEPVFFAEELPRVAHRAWLPATLEEYLSLFVDALPDQRVGEASATYLWSASAAHRIAELQPQARAIAILREPASFLRSLHLQNLQSHYETERHLRDALAAEEDRRCGRRVPSQCLRPQALLYSEYVRFVEQLGRYRAVFGEEQMLVLLYDDFRADNEATVRRVLGFLGVDDGVAVNPVEANPTVRLRSQRLDELMHTVSVGRGGFGGGVKLAIKAVAPRSVRRGMLGVARRRLVLSSPPLPDEELMLELRRRYKPEVVALSEYLGRDLVSLWGYDRLG
jgi:Sulfotransferase family